MAWIGAETARIKVVQKSCSRSGSITDPKFASIDLIIGREHNLPIEVRQFSWIGANVGFGLYVKDKGAGLMFGGVAPELTAVLSVIRSKEQSLFNKQKIRWK